MRSLARFALAGPVQAILVVFGFALLSFPFPILIIFSGGALALVTLHFGIKHSAQILLASILLVYVSTFFIFKSVTTGPLITWTSVLALTYVYRNTKSLNLTLQLSVIFGMVVIVLIALLIPDMQTHWLNYLQGMFETIEKDPALAAILENARLTRERVQQFLPVIASVMTGGLVSLYLQTICAALFLGRWWKGLQDNIRPFREEFVAIRLGKVIAALAILFIVAALVVKHAIFWQLALVCLSMFSIQGLAIVHALVGQMSNPIFGFVVVYGLLFFAAPQMVVALSALGVMDSFINLRVRFAKT